MVKVWSVFLSAATNMLREAMIMPGPYVASTVAGSIIAYSMSLSSQLNVFGMGIGIAVAYALASMEVLSVRTVIKLWRVKTNSFYTAIVVTIFALAIEWIILILADSTLPWILRIVGLAFCVLPGIMYALQSLNEWTDEQIGSTIEKEKIETELIIQRKKKEQEIELMKLAERAKWEVEQEKIKLQNSQEKALAKISVKKVSNGVKKDDILTYMIDNPDCKPSEVSDMFGISRQTFYNYLAEIKNGHSK